MFQLITVIISIALMAAIAAVSINYLPLDAQLRQMTQLETDHGLQSLEGTVTRYLAAQPRDEQGNVIFAGDGRNLVADVTPTYGYLPANVGKNFTWELNAGMYQSMPAVGICVRPLGVASTMAREVLAKVQERLPKGAAVIGSTCNAVSNMPSGAYLTYWLPAQHLAQK